jgi:acyl dehydratase
MMANDAVAAGHEIPPWMMEFVDPARMKTMAAILRDPYTVHWDRAGNERLGFAGRVINQGPLNVGYIANMLIAWAGPDCIRRLTLAFARPVLDGDCVTARGLVTAVDTIDGERLATCDVWLERADERVVNGTAIVRLPSVPQPAGSSIAEQKETPT